MGLWLCAERRVRGASLPRRRRRWRAPPARALAVGVVTTEPPEWIAAALATAGLTAVQLSAGADGPTVAATRAAALSRGLRPLVIAAADTPDAADADLVLVDARAPGVYGGSGATLDWRALAADERLPTAGLVLAGGLTVGNVAEAIALVRPLAVDTSSGVELAGAPGHKDDGLLRAFLCAVREADGGATVARTGDGARATVARAGEGADVADPTIAEVTP